MPGADCGGGRGRANVGGASSGKERVAGTGSAPPTHSGTPPRDGARRRGLCGRSGHKARAPVSRTCSLTRHHTGNLLLSATERHNEGLAGYGPGSRPSLDSAFASIWILDILASRITRNKCFCFFSHSVSMALLQQAKLRHQSNMFDLT